MRVLLRQEVKREMAVIYARLEAHDNRLLLVETGMRTIEIAVNATRLDVASVTGMLTGFIGTREVAGKFDEAIDRIEASAERANVISHSVSASLRDLESRVARWEGVQEGRTESSAEQVVKDDRRMSIVKVVVGSLVTAGSALCGWLYRHLHWSK